MAVSALTPSPFDPADANERVGILIVDDLPEKLLAFSSVLEDLGQDLVLVRSGSEALREVLEREFAVILLDVNMPDIDGLETARLIRGYRKSAHTPIIFVTAYADELQTERGYSLGAVDYILSPVVPQILRSKVKVFVDLHNARQRVRRQADATIALAAAQTARALAEANTRRADFLLRATRVLSGSLEPHVASRHLLELLVPQVASLAMLVQLDEDQGIRGALVGRRDGTGVPLPATVRIDEVAADDLPPTLAGLVAAALAHTNSVMLESPGPHAALLAALRGFADGVPLVAGAAVALAAGPRPMAVLIVAGDDAQFLHGSTREGGAHPPVCDRAGLHELASRAAIALENARLYKSLQIEIEERRRAEARLRDADRRKDQFLAMLSHELRNPLAPIRNAMELVRRLAPPDPRIELAGQMMDRQVTHMMQLVEELLDVARIGQGKIALRREPIDLAGLIEHAVDMSRPLTERLRHTLHVQLPDTPVRLIGDFNRLAQVIANLLNNAAKYTKEGGTIRLTADVNAGEAVIRVVDNGVGIEPDLLPCVFDLFEQGTRTLDRSQGGLGIGLNVARQLVEAHQGRIEAHSDGPECGATFTVYLPCVSVVSGDVPKPVIDVRQRHTRGLRVLIVEDNRDAADSVALYLGLEGHLVKTVGDGARALEVAAVFEPQVVVLDIGLPGLDGYETARRLRASPVTRDALMIALTGYGQNEDRERAREAGFDRHLIKPANMKVLSNLIAEFGSDVRVALKAERGS